MKKNFLKVLMFALLAGFVACNDDDPTPQGMGDVYITSKWMPAAEEGGSPTAVYGLHIDAYGMYGTVSEVKVKAGSSEYTLDKDDDYDLFSWETDEDEFSTTKPAAGTYTYTFKFSTGETYTLAEALSDKALLPVTITSATFADSKLTVEWEEIDDAQAIYVQMKKSDGEVVYSSKRSDSDFLDDDVTEWVISQSTGSWKSGYTVTNGVYTVEVIALLGGSSSYLQAISTAAISATWGSAS